MKKYLILVAALVVILGGAVIGYNKLTEIYSPESNVGSTGQADGTELTADIKVVNRDGEEVYLSEYFGKPIILNFWATWCSPCKSEMPDFEEAYKEYGDQIEFVMVNQTDGSQDTVESAAEFIDETGYTFPIYFDTTLSASAKYHVTSIPRTFFINADGTLMAEYKGMMTAEMLQEYIDALLSAENSGE